LVAFTYYCCVDYGEDAIFEKEKGIVVPTDPPAYDSSLKLVISRIGLILYASHNTTCGKQSMYKP